MWREEIGITEMLFAYIGEIAEFHGWSSWRRVVVEILTCHEEARRQRNSSGIIYKIEDNSNDEQIMIMKTAANSENPVLEKDATNVFLNEVPPQLNTNEGVQEGWLHSEDDMKMKCKDLKKSITFNESLPSSSQPRVFNESVGTMHYSSSYCDKIITDNVSEYNPQSLLTDENLFSCSESRTSYSHKLKSQSPLPLDSGKRPYACTYCEKTFTHKGNKVKHEQKMHGGGPFSCNYCAKSFSQYDLLKSHESIHNGERPYACTYCGKMFSLKYNKVKHEHIVHKGIKPFSCRFCGKLFSRNDVRTRHESIHTGENRYKCSYCDKTFAYPMSLRYHERSYHEEN